MQFKNNLAALGSGVVLSLSLISCNGNDVVTKPAANNSWGLAEPTIISADGSQTKYGDANTKSSLTFSVDDRLQVKDMTREIQLRFRTSCARGEERWQYADIFAAQPEYALIEFMPMAILYAPSGAPLVNVTCTLEVSALHANGSKQNFPTLNLVMNDKSMNRLELLNKMRPLSSADKNIVSLDDLADVTLPQISEAETLKIQCENFSGQSSNKFGRNLTDLKIAEGQLTGKEQAPQVCRVFKTIGDHVIAASPFFTIQFFNNNGILRENNNAVFYGNDKNGVPNGRILLRQQKIINPMPTDIFLRIPKYMAGEAVTKTFTYTYPTNAQIVTTVAGGTILTENNESYVIQLKPNQPAMIRYMLWTMFSCQESIVSISFKEKNPNINIQAIDSLGKIVLAEWKLINEQFSPYTTGFKKNKVAGNDTVNYHVCSIH